MKIDRLRTLPLLALLLLSAALAFGLFNPPQSPPSPLVGQTLAALDFPSIGNEARFSSAAWQNKVAVLNVFASWCEPCAIEHTLLMKLSGKLPLYGLAWRDKPEAVAKWLAAHGNPYALVGIDAQGQATIPLALTGVPETFVVDKKGIIRYHTRAALTDDRIDEILSLTEALDAN